MVCSILKLSSLVLLKYNNMYNIPTNFSQAIMNFTFLARRKHNRLTLDNFAYHPECWEKVDLIFWTPIYVQILNFRCNRRLETVCSDRKFWREVHDVCDGSSPLHVRLRKFFSDSTTSVYLSQTTGVSSNQTAEECESSCFQNNFLGNLRSLSNLKTFILENHTFSYGNVRNSNFSKIVLEY